MFTKEWFLDLEGRLRVAGLDSDSMSFGEIKKNLQKRRVLTPNEFANQCAYVILAGGFSQKTAKKVHVQIMDVLHRSCGCTNLYPKLIQIFNNKNKINAIIKIWQNAGEYRDSYYELKDTDARVVYLATLPHIGKITANHLARNLGENVVKYDIWIQRLAIVFAGQKQSSKFKVQSSDINNASLHPDIKSAADAMFSHLEKQTGLPRGYIDVVLWKACQNKLIKIPHLLD